MALDASLFTLHFLRREADPSITDLTRSATPTSSQLPFYVRRRARASPVYDSVLLDGTTELPLAGLKSATSGEKSKTVKLYHPEQEVEVNKQGMTFHQDWRFTWEGEVYQFRREASLSGGSPSFHCEAIRKPDPAISVAMYKPSSKNRAALMQIFDYNLARLTINDKRGLEITMIMLLFSLIDYDYDERHKAPNENMYLPSGNHEGHALGTSASNGPADQSQEDGTLADPEGSRELNQVPISARHDINTYVQHCIELLKEEKHGGKGLSIIILTAASPETTPRAIAVAAEVKAAFYRLPPATKGRTLDGTVSEELYQYVRESFDFAETPATSGTPRPRILNPDSKVDSRRPYTPPSSLTIFLSKDQLAEFDPPAPPPSRLSPKVAHGKPSNVAATSHPLPPKRMKHRLSPSNAGDSGLSPHTVTDSGGKQAGNSNSSSGDTSPRPSRRFLEKLGLSANSEHSDKSRGS